MLVIQMFEPEFLIEKFIFINKILQIVVTPAYYMTKYIFHVDLTLIKRNPSK